MEVSGTYAPKVLIYDRDEKGSRRLDANARTLGCLLSSNGFAGNLELNLTKVDRAKPFPGLPSVEQIADQAIDSGDFPYDVMVVYRQAREGEAVLDTLHAALDLIGRDAKKVIILDSSSEEHNLYNMGAVRIKVRSGDGYLIEKDGHALLEEISKAAEAVGRTGQPGQHSLQQQ